MDILVIGSLNMDLIVDTPRMPVQGETILGGTFSTAQGGKGANQAVAAARLAGPGTRVRMAGCVGDDAFGRQLVEGLASDGVDITSLRQVEKTSSGVAVIVLENGLNRILVAPGANAALTEADIDRLSPLMREGDLLVIQLEIPLPVVGHALALARQKGMRILLNPAPVPPTPLPDEWLAMADVLTPNETECTALTGMPCTTVEEAGVAAMHLVEKGIPQVIVTLGKHGVLSCTAAETRHYPVPEVHVVDTTAAGDAFSGALAVGLAEGLSPDDAIRFANLAGTLAVTKAGAQPSLPRRAEVDAYSQTTGSARRKQS